ncbi:MAG: hypothetical protein ABEJ77_00400 [Halanaeroarchaeum sp.]
MMAGTLGPAARRSIRRVLRPVAVGSAALVVLSTGVRAHVGGLSGGRESLAVPIWLVLLTAGAVIGASFLLVSMLTDRRFIAALHDWGGRYRWAPPTGGRLAGRLTGLLALVATVVVGALGPRSPAANLAVLGVWALWWAGFTMSVYLAGNAWPLLNPWRTLVEWIPVSLDRRYPDRVGSWPSVVGLLALVWVEVTSGLTTRPTRLAGLALVYTAITVAGGIVFGAEDWFDRADPISHVFAVYGRIAPIDRTGSGLSLGLPGSHVVTDPIAGWDDVTFVIALLWLTTFDGFVATPTWRAIAVPLAGLGVPPIVLYGGLFVGGLGLFAAAYVLATRAARHTAGTVLSTKTMAVRFAGSLLPIAAGYHLAHYLGYFLTYLPSVGYLLTDPLSPPGRLPVFAVPSAIGTLQLAFVLVGHVVAIWIAHGVAFETLTGRLQPIRSQYPYTAIMVAYTMVSVAIVYQPTVTPPFL